MKSTGIVRKMDKLGRIVLPVELRKSLKIDLNTPLEMFVDGDYILLKKYHPAGACDFCGEISDDVAVFGADTDASPYDSGSYASSTTYVTGKAV